MNKIKNFTIEFVSRINEINFWKIGVNISGFISCMNKEINIEP